MNRQYLQNWEKTNINNIKVDVRLETKYVWTTNINNIKVDVEFETKYVWIPFNHVNAF